MSNTFELSKASATETTDLSFIPVTAHEPISWRGDQIDPDSFRKTLTPNQVAALLAEDAKAPALRELRATIMADLELGTGICVLEGLYGHCQSEAEYNVASLMLARVIGTTVAQNKAGENLVLVKDAGGSTINPTQRGHKTSDALGFHNDRCDIILLTCIHQAEIGGESFVVSTKYAHDEIARKAPEHLRTLYGTFPNHRRGEERVGEAPWCQIPVFAWVEDKFVCRYVKRFIADSQILPEAPRMTGAQFAALEYMDELINTPGVYLEFKMKPGDLFLVNNHAVLHGRSEYIDSGPTKRTLARVWLSHPESRALPESFAPLYRDTRGGAVRGGI